MTPAVSGNGDRDRQILNLKSPRPYLKGPGIIFQDCKGGTLISIERGGQAGQTGPAALFLSWASPMASFAQNAGAVSQPNFHCYEASVRNQLTNPGTLH